MSKAPVKFTLGAGATDKPFKFAQPSGKLAHFCIAVQTAPARKVK
jgi:hypothetical protein